MKTAKASAPIAFSMQSSSFDAEDRDNPILQYMRENIRKEVCALLKPGSNILELNAGTGLDAAYFAEKGHQVVATDLADGMIEQLNQKAAKSTMQNRLGINKLDFRELDPLKDQKFDLIFSNFGGLNCASDLHEVFSQFPNLLKPGGKVFLVIMPPVCPWEISHILKGKFALAFRRLSGKTRAHLEGAHFTTWYFSPRQVKKAMPDGFELIRLKGLGTIMPQPHMQHFPVRFPKAFSWLKKTEPKINHLFPFNRWADHFLIALQRKE